MYTHKRPNETVFIVLVKDFQPLLGKVLFVW